MHAFCGRGGRLRIQRLQDAAESFAFAGNRNLGFLSFGTGHTGDFIQGMNQCHRLAETRRGQRGRSIQSKQADKRHVITRIELPQVHDHHNELDVYFSKPDSWHETSQAEFSGNVCSCQPTCDEVRLHAWAGTTCGTLNHWRRRHGLVSTV